MNALKAPTTAAGPRQTAWNTPLADSTVCLVRSTAIAWTVLPTLQRRFARTAAAPVARAIRIAVSTVLKVCTVDGSIDGSIDGSSTDGSTDGSGIGTVTGGGNGSTDDGIVNMAGSGDELTGGSGARAPGGQALHRKVLRLVNAWPAWWLPIARLCTARRKTVMSTAARQTLATLDVNECLTGEHECDQGYECVNSLRHL